MVRRVEPQRVVVVGAGVAGSMLVQALAASGSRTTVVLVDPLPRPGAGRRWAGWDTGRSDDRARAFTRVRVAGPAFELVLHTHEHRYAVWEGEQLDARTDAALHRLGGERIATTATDVLDDGDLRVDTAAGALTGDLVLDSVGLGKGTDGAGAVAWLHFVGYQVRASSTAFDPELLTLMDFGVPQRGEVRFVYVVPVSPCSALVELTAFSRSPLPAPLDGDLGVHLDETLGAGTWTRLAREAGTLPLNPWPPRRGRAPYLRIGSAAGLVKASTGYGFPLMRRDADLIAARIAAGRPARGLRRRRRHAWMDAVFLELAVTEPATLVDALQRLFERNPLERVVRFLDESSSIVDEVRLVATLPSLPFVRAATRVARYALPGRRGARSRARRSA